MSPSVEYLTKRGDVIIIGGDKHRANVWRERRGGYTDGVLVARIVVRVIDQGIDREPERMESRGLAESISLWLSFFICRCSSAERMVKDANGL